MYQYPKILPAGFLAHLFALTRSRSPAGPFVLQVYALAPDKQEAVATETRKIWCTLAERLGMFAMKSELEDLCFAVLEPSAYGALRGDQEELWELG